MFVTQNTLSAIKNHFFEELIPFYEETEVNAFFYLLSESFLGFTKTDVLLGISKNLSESELLKYHYAIKELKQFKPIQFITGKQYFYNNEFKVTRDTLIPRPETEELVELIVKENEGEAISILDIGTGTGAIAISLDLAVKECTVDAFDVSKEALKVAQENKEVLNSSVKFSYQDILNPTYEGKQFDLIVSNPPYVLKKEKELMKDNVLKYEPHLALFVEDNDPLLFYRRIVDFCKTKLKQGGKLYVEINEQYGNETLELFKKNGFTSSRLIQDINGKDRIVTGINNNA